MVIERSFDGRICRWRAAIIHLQCRRELWLQSFFGKSVQPVAKLARYNKRRIESTNLWLKMLTFFEKHANAFRNYDCSHSWLEREREWERRNVRKERKESERERERVGIRRSNIPSPDLSLLARQRFELRQLPPWANEDFFFLFWLGLLPRELFVHRNRSTRHAQRCSKIEPCVNFRAHDPTEKKKKLQALKIRKKDALVGLDERQMRVWLQSSSKKKRVYSGNPSHTKHGDLEAHGICIASALALRVEKSNVLFWGTFECEWIVHRKIEGRTRRSKSNPHALGLLCLLSKPRSSEAQRAHLSSSCTETLNSNSSAPNQNNWDSCLERQIDFRNWAYLFKHEERFSSDLSSVQAICCLPATCLRHRYTWKKKPDLWTFRNSCMGKSAKYCEYLRGHLKSSHIADKRKNFHMALYPHPPVLKRKCDRQWGLFIFISRKSKWGTLKSAGNPRCAVPAESHSIFTDRPRPGPAAALQVSPTSDTCQSVAILMNRPHWRNVCQMAFTKHSLSIEGTSFQWNPHSSSQPAQTMPSVSRMQERFPGGSASIAKRTRW